MTPATAVEARGLTKSFSGRQVVCGVDLKIPTGVCFGLLGPNGAGKTTTIRMLLGLSPFEQGTLSVFGQTMPESAREIRRRIGMVPQSDNLDPDFTVRENLLVYASYFGMPKDSIEARMAYLLDFAALTDRADSRIAYTVRRHETTADHRPLAGQRSGIVGSGRADDRFGPPSQAFDLGSHAGSQEPRKDATADDGTTWKKLNVCVTGS